MHGKHNTEALSWALPISSGDLGWVIKYLHAFVSSPTLCPFLLLVGMVSFTEHNGKLALDGSSKYYCNPDEKEGFFSSVVEKLWPWKALTLCFCCYFTTHSLVQLFSLFWIRKTSTWCKCLMFPVDQTGRMEEKKRSNSKVILTEIKENGIFNFGSNAVFLMCQNNWFWCMWS